jgi:hypothetical protein
MVDARVTQTSTIYPRASSITHYALGAIFLIPLLIGVFLVSTSANRTDRANQVSRDLASMYAQGVDFAKEANRDIALRLAEGLGLDLAGGKGVVILSKIHVVRDADCLPAAPGRCVNKGLPVIVQRFVIGNAGLRASSLGAPLEIDASSGNVRDWPSDFSARAQEFSADLKPGEYTYSAECYLLGSEARAGVYSRSMF